LNSHSILVINGPNANLFGLREATIYGATDLVEINQQIETLARELDASIVEYFQSNHEGDIVDRIQKCLGSGVSGILINPTAYGHTSIAIRDALKAVELPFVEVHISNTFAREPFRHKTFLSDIASGVVIGFGANSYLLGLRGLVDRLRAAT
jgi:3-dehydroquinate dehydratase-2